MDLGNLKNDNFVQKQHEGFRDENLFTPDPAKGQNGVYKAGIRYIPWWKDPNNSMYKKYQAILTHPLTKEKFFVECPSTIRQSSILWDLDTLLRNKIRNHIDENLAKEIKVNFNRYMNVYAPVYIIKDMQDSTLNGKIKLWPFGITILKQIEKQIEPESLGIGVVKSINPFSMLEGKDYFCIVSKKNKQYKDYDSCQFVEQVTPFTFQFEGQVYTVDQAMLDATTKSDETPLARFLKAETPNLDAYKFKPWTVDIRDKVADYIIAIVQYPSILQELLSTTRDLETKTLILSKMKEREAIAQGFTGMPTVTNAPIIPTAEKPVINEAEGKFVFDNQPTESLVTPPVVVQKPIVAKEQAQPPVVQNTGMDMETELNKVQPKVEDPVVNQPATETKLENTNFATMLEKL